MSRASPAHMLVGALTAALLTQGSANDDVRRSAFGFASAGGGFTAMTGSMGMTRALHKAGLLEGVTHLSAVSGSVWHSVPLAYSQSYYDDITNDTLSVSDLVAAWGVRYEGKMKGAVDLAVMANWTFDAGTAAFCPKSWTNESTGETVQFSEVVSNVITDLTSSLVWPAANWFTYVGLILETGGITDPTMSFKSERKGLKTAKLVTGASLPPDTWLTASGGTSLRTLDPVFDEATYVSGTQRKFEKVGSTFPIMHVVPAGADPDSSSFLYPEDVTPQLEGHPPIDLNLTVDQSLQYVTAGSSSAAGFMGSSTLLNQLMTWGLREIGGLSKIVTAAVVPVIMGCFPAGFQTLSAPLPTEVAPASSIDGAGPSYRYLDGAFTEGTGIAWAVSQLVADCNETAAGLDCSNITLAAYNDVSATDGSGANIRDLFTWTGNTGTGTDEKYFIPLHLSPAAWTQPNTRIFATDYSNVEWHVYANYTYVVDGNSSGPMVSYYSLTHTTTFANPGYRITGGTDMTVIVVQPAVPPKDLIIWPGLQAEYGFAKIYGPIAQMIYANAEPLFTELKESGTITPPTNVVPVTYCFGAPPQYQVLDCEPMPPSSPPSTPPLSPPPPSSPPVPPPSSPPSPPPPPSLPPLPIRPSLPPWAPGTVVRVIAYDVVTVMIAEGSVSDFTDDDKDAIKRAVADALGVEPEKVVVTVTSASVRIKTVVAYDTEDAANSASATLSGELYSAEAASTFFSAAGINVTSTPEVDVKAEEETINYVPTDDVPCFAADSTTACKLVGNADAEEAHRQCFTESNGADAALVLMKTLSAGDTVLAADATGTLSLQRVVFNQHKAIERSSALLELHHSAGVLALTPDHVLLVNGDFAPARDAKPGSVLALANGQAVTIERVSAAHGRIINPVTASGTIVAGGVIAATHPEWSAALMMANWKPFPLLYGLSAAFPESFQAYYEAVLEPLFDAVGVWIKPVALRAAARFAPLIAADAAAAIGLLVFVAAVPACAAALGLKAKRLLSLKL